MGFVGFHSGWHAWIKEGLGNWLQNDTPRIAVLSHKHVGRSLAKSGKYNLVRISNYAVVLLSTPKSNSQKVQHEIQVKAVSFRSLQYLHCTASSFGNKAKAIKISWIETSLAYDLIFVLIFEHQRSPIILLTYVFHG